MNRYGVRIGLRVVIVSKLDDTKDLGIAKEHLHVRRPDEEGVVESRASADGGYLWWVRHNDNTMGIYGFDEFNPAKGYFYAVDYLWRDGEFLKVGRIISSEPGTLEAEVEKLTNKEPCSISAIRGPFERETDAQAAPKIFLASFGRSPEKT
ncbi:MAG: hypothetical protein PHO90_01245 [Candidatus Pacebacteria bacterium]|nr:hypothetical protein [Candidatus Paceibacterota bacterium]